MIDPVEELKIRAQLLHRALEQKRPEAVARLRVLPDFRRLEDSELASAMDGVRHKQCLSIIARELGFQGFQHASRVLQGDPSETDFGKLLYPSAWGGSYLNHWSVDYDEARALRASTGGYLLAYVRQFFVVQAGFVEALGLEPHDADWEQLGWDWPRPRDPAARVRLYGKLLGARAREAP